MQAAGALIPWHEVDGVLQYKHEEHGTAFFISADGFFLTAGHVVDGYPEFMPALEVMIISAFGLARLPVLSLKRHPVADVALGRALVDPAERTKPFPMTLSSRRLEPGADVAVLGAAQTETETALDADGQPWQRFKFRGPDYFEGEVLDYLPDGTTIAPRFPTYATSVIPPSPIFPTLGGASGGPLVAPDSIDVHGIFITGSDGYSLCTDILPLLDWEVFDDEFPPARTLREAAALYPWRITVR